MRIAFVGRAGSGKTTCGAVFSRYLGAQGLPVLAIDAGAHPRLGPVLGLCVPPAAPAWLDELHVGASEVGEPVRRHARLDDLDPAGELLARHAVAAPDGVRLLVTDAVGPLLDHLVDGEREYVVVDLAADPFAAGLCARFDMTVLVTEPTRRDIEAYQQYAGAASEHGVELRVLGNKISDWGDAAWLTEQVLGIRSIARGFRHVIIRPDLAGLQWAQGAEPTPRGLLKVSVRPHEVQITVPPGTDAFVQLPFG